MKPSVYIETSIISALVDERDDVFTQAQRMITEEWWDKQAPKFNLFYGEAVASELQQEVFPRQEEAMAFLASMKSLPLNDTIKGVTRICQEHFLMPKGALGDAVHLATACVHKMNYLLTWNCRHLANTNKIQHMRTINYRLGLVTPELVTPQILVAFQERSENEER